MTRRVVTYYLYSPDEPELRGWWVQLVDGLGADWEDGPHDDYLAARALERRVRLGLALAALVKPWHRLVDLVRRPLAPWLLRRRVRRLVEAERRQNK